MATLLVLGALAACGKKGSLRLPRPGETDEGETADDGQGETTDDDEQAAP